MTGLACLRQGFSLIFKKGTKRFSLGPLAITALLYLLLGTYLFQQFAKLVDWGVEAVPGWLGFLVPLVWLLFAILGLVMIGYTFALLAMIVCSPFHGLLAEKVAEDLGYRNFDEKLTTAVVLRIAKRALSREWTKLCYNLPRAILVVLIALALSFVPVLGLLAPLVTFLWAAWSMAVQFIDFPADNDQVDFRPMLVKMKANRSNCLAFGGATIFLLSIPLVNLLTIPAAVAGATKFWLERIESNNSATLR